MNTSLREAFHATHAVQCSREAISSWSQYEIASHTPCPPLRGGGALGEALAMTVDGDHAHYRMGCQARMGGHAG